MSLQMSTKLTFLMKKASLTQQQFVDDFTKSTKVRKAVVEEWLEDKRTPYGQNLEKIAVYWRRYIPTITAAHFVMPVEDFQLALMRALAADTSTGVVLPMQTNAVDASQITALAGSYKLFRYATGATPSIICEALSIYAKENEPTLEVKLWSPLAKDVQTFVGTVIMMGDRVYLVLPDTDANSAAMRFITLHGRFTPKNTTLFGIMSGAFDRDDTLSSMTIAMSKQSSDPKLAVEETSWRTLNAIESVDKDIIIALSTTKTIDTTK